MAQRAEAMPAYRTCGGAKIWKKAVRGDYVDDSWNAAENISVKFMQDSTIIVIR